MRLLVLHGPNLNLLGERPGDVPGVTLASVEAAVRTEAARRGFTEVRFVQSNHEGALVDTLQAARHWATAVLLNPGALTHSSWVLHDALAATRPPVVEVHLSNLDALGPARRQWVLEGVVEGRIHGRGLAGYVEALELLGREAGAFLAHGLGDERGTGTDATVSVQGAVTSSGTTGAGAVGTGAAAGSGAAAGVSGRDATASVQGAVTSPGTTGAGAVGPAAAAGSGATAGVSGTDATARVQGAVTSSGTTGAGPVSPAGAHSAAGSTGSAVAQAAPSGSSSAWNVANLPPAPGVVSGAPATAAPQVPAPRKTLGRRRPEPNTGAPVPTAGAAWPSGVPTRADIASRIARHLSGSEPASALAAFAREGWMRLEAGAEVPPSERPLLEDVLRRLMFLDRKAGALDAQDLVDLLARLQ